MATTPQLHYRDPGGAWVPYHDPAIVSTPGGFLRSIAVISAATAAGATPGTDYVYVCTAALILTLPTAVGNRSLYTVKRTGGGGVTIATTGSQTIDGTATFVLAVPWLSIDVVSDGANWVVV